MDYLIIILCLTQRQKIPRTKSYGGFRSCSEIIFWLAFDTPNYLSRRFFHACLFCPFLSISLVDCYLCFFRISFNTRHGVLFCFHPSLPPFAFSFVQLLCTFLASNLVRLWCSLKLFSPYLSVLLSSLHRARVSFKKVHYYLRLCVYIYMYVYINYVSRVVDLCKP